MPNRIPQHRPPRPLRVPEDRPSSAARGYDRQWRKLRAQKLHRDPLCEEPGCTRAATEVDHVRAIAAGGARLDLDNLRSLCKSHHSAKTVRVDGGLGKIKKQPQPGDA